MRRRALTVGLAVGLLALLILTLGPRLRREFFPEVDGGAFEVAVRAPAGTRLERTEQRVAQVEDVIRDQLGDELEMVISEIGDFSSYSS